MAHLKSIRERLGLSQAELGAVMGCVQGNITAYEREDKPRPVPHWRAAKVIAFARSRDLVLSFDHFYSDTPLPERAVAEAVAHG
ncbi:DNA-binding XRE family transcriptional regulator [Acidovorax delafieldii]|uniref:DNA-binding XRE family transcriptional regulator n=1 Tax=Acidovorax delafieldii TaxID=47920 RepID=A0AAJ2BSG3_ACIDE|nr:helix-turn-helix transcriptional regulator [Acidovorax delafieldii]MDR6767707.1 DNA-binding XRE family transcriptional regulator [Acidovorax delafieldii]MDR6839689.1 DNA-binding XRE family transcriptional regulator [Acidovorax delafieldii]MDR7368410.1 DNA-binding XRE family transcriptional regulator [Acidovorax delafieldii]